MKNSERDDRVTQLALAAGRGDKTALTEFIRETQNDVWRLLAHLGGSEIADDLTQETYLRVMSALPDSLRARQHEHGYSHSHAACGWTIFAMTWPALESLPRK